MSRDVRGSVASHGSVSGRHHAPGGPGQRRDIRHRPGRRRPPIVLLHGQGGSLENFRHNVPALAARYHVVAPDLLWHGRSDTPPVDRRLIPVWVNQVLDLMQELKLGPSHLLGQSLGGWVAATIALQHPELVRSLVLTTPMGLDPGAPAGHESLAPVLKAQIAALDELSMDSIRARMSPLFGDSDLLDDEIIGVRHAFYSDPDVNRALREVASAYLGSTDTDPYRLGPDALAQISVPNPSVLGHAQFRRRRSRRRPRPGLARNRRVPLRGRGPLRPSSTAASGSATSSSSTGATAGRPPCRRWECGRGTGWPRSRRTRTRNWRRSTPCRSLGRCWCR